MRFYKKGPVPHSLEKWLRENEVNRRFSDLPSDVKADIRSALLKEQGYLDAYTMQRIEADSCHIEHFRPQAHSTDEDAVDYGNMLACWPLDRRSPTAWAPGDSYGAEYKGDSEEAICSPLKEADVLNAFEYRFDGTIVGRTELAKTTIHVLNLNAERLRAYRREAIRGAFGIAKSPLGSKRLFDRARLTAAAAKRRLQAISLPDEAGRLQPFCAAIEQQLARWIERQESRAARLRKKPGDAQ